MLWVARVYSPLVGLVFSALIAGCATTPGVIPGGESTGAPPLRAPDSPVARESASSELVWAEYPTDAAKFLEDMLPVLAVSLDLPFLNDPSCAEMPVWVVLDEFGTTVPLSLSNDAITATMGFLPFIRESSLGDAALQETSAFRRHCNDVVSAEARYRSVVDSIPADAPEESVRRTIGSASDGRSVLVGQSFQIYLDEQSYLVSNLRFIACYLRIAFPDDSSVLFENLQAEWQSQVLQAYQLSNFVWLESRGLPYSITARDLTKFWVEHEWGSEGSLEAWLCGGPQ